MVPVSKHSVGRPYGHLAVALGIPNQSDAREEPDVARAIQPVSAAITWIARKRQTRGAFVNTVLVEFWLNRRLVEVGELSVLVKRRRDTAPSGRRNSPSAAR